MKSLLEYIKSQPESTFRVWLEHAPGPMVLDSFLIMRDFNLYGLAAFERIPLEVQSAILINYYRIYQPIL